MWEPKIIKYDDLVDFNPIAFLNGSNSALVIRNFYDEWSCSTLAKRIISKSKLKTPEKIKTIGPFLMSYATKKEEYFEQSMHYDKVFSELFSNLESPITKIKNLLEQLFPKFFFDFASEHNRKYSKCIIRNHENNDFVPIHKDNVTYEGKNYGISNIDFQISCVLHLQEAQNGGEITIYKKQWTKSDELNRKIDFGYEKEFLDNVEKSIIFPQRGDLVIINCNYFHSVGKVTGKRNRITLGMFAGFERKKHQAVIWA